MKRLRVVLLGGMIMTSQLIYPERAEACEICKNNWLTPWNFLCKPVSDRETGVTDCENDYHPFTNTTSCSEGGDFCAVIDAAGGGGGGSGGGGSNPCQVSGFCPAECFSCSGNGGSGGRPAV
jgi:hypothetical protein